MYIKTNYDNKITTAELKIGRIENYYNFKNGKNP